jgi:hypothetical protein
MLAENILYTVPQQIFTVFYDITWGTAANSQPRWKAFAWGAFRYPATKKRAGISLLILDILPLAYFVVIIMLCLNGPTWGNLVGAGKIFVSTLAALAPFGFYRAWTALVQWRREMFYGPLPERDIGPCEPDNRPEHWRKIGIRLELESDLNPKWALPNFLWGMAYVLIGPAILLVIWCRTKFIP